MKESSYFSKNLMNKQVLFSAIFTAYKNLLWPLVGIGLPIVIFGLNGSIFEKAFFFIVITIVLFIPYLVLCFLVHKLSLKSKDDLEKFYSLDPKERGKVIGDELSGWW
ncbi:hypothetical protein IDAT_04105 [Pseudidiomarina atlantica]|uniref:Uncharacterized protein n=1 Tax=Pseudidiomarina atlantica TaxID=1517416 RepID=A0A094J9S1_9GAMM|nr:hypothetical protein [Pseudidiomarina atlantica]KFZ29311.1 hypothetical protein IDAT_04105 [Pseudidiomarina atlantica]